VTGGHNDRDLNYVYFRDDKQPVDGPEPNKDIERARRFKQPGEQLLWFRDGGQDYVIRDPATLKSSI